MLQRKISILLLILLSLSIILSFTSINAYAEDQQAIQLADENTINAGIYVISIGNFEFSKGTYVLDFYLIFTWENQNLSPASFEFMNGRPITKEKIYEDYTNESSEIWYRIQANLF
jgi:hypothetical protein